MQKPDEGDGLPYTNLNLTHVDVDLNGLTDFRSLLQRELHINLRPVADGIIANHGVGVMFGDRTPGQGMYAARERYREALVASTQNSRITSARRAVDHGGRAT
jgi:hypothetical protein